MGTGISPNFVHKQCSKEYSRILKLQHLSSWISRLRNWIHKQDKGSTHSRATQCDIVHQRPAVVDGTLSLRKFYIMSCVGRCTCEVLLFHRKMPLLTANLLNHKILLGHHCLSIQCPPEFVSKGSSVHVNTTQLGLCQCNDAEAERRRCRRSTTVWDRPNATTDRPRWIKFATAHDDRQIETEPAI